MYKRQTQPHAVEPLRDSQIGVHRVLVDTDGRRGVPVFEAVPVSYTHLSQEFCTKLLEQKHVALVPGDAFGASGEGYCRVSYAYSVEHLTEALKRIREFLQENGLVQGN